MIKSKWFQRLTALVIFILVIIIGVMSYLLPTLHNNFLKDAYIQNILSIQSLSGALIKSDPELEEVITKSLKYDLENMKYGAEILQKYGYDTDLLINESIEFQYLKNKWNTYMIIYCVFIAMVIVLFAFFILILYDRKNRNLTEVLDNYVNGKYIFPDTKRLGLKIGNEGIMWDTIIKLGKKIKLDNERLESEKEGTKSIVTDISHQLKNPIAALKISFLMLTEAHNEEERKEFLTYCNKQIDNLERLTKSLVNISRLETMMIELKADSVSLEEILFNAVNSIYYKAQSKNIEIQMNEFKDFLLPLDKKWTTEAIINVLDNSVKYSRENSKIIIFVDNRIDFIHIEITDFGIGIPKEDFTKVFKRFYRGSNEKVKNSEGSGVGLYLTRMILEKQGGGISIKKRHIGSTTFVVQIRKL